MVAAERVFIKGNLNVQTVGENQNYSEIGDQKRLWHRRDYDMHQTDNVAANFYPVTSAIVVKDKNSDKQVSEETRTSSSCKTEDTTLMTSMASLSLLTI